MTIEARKRLREYLHSQNLTPTEFSRLVGVNQSTVQRFLEGRTKSITQAIRVMLSYADIDVNTCINSAASTILESDQVRLALEKVWDGQEVTAQALARLLTVMAPLIPLIRPPENINH